jgi:hypothetical protein
MEPPAVAPERAEISAAMAQAALERDRQWRVQECAREIQPILERYQCQITGAFIWEDGQGQVQVQIVAR